MRVAVPLFGQDVAPRFGYATSFLIAELKGNRIMRRDQINVELGGWPTRLGQLRSRGVEVILCGGFNRCFIPLAEDLGMDIIVGLGGDADEVVEAFARGDEMPAFPYLPRGVQRHRRGRGRGMGFRHRRRGNDQTQ